MALRIDDVSVHVYPHLPFILAFPTIENSYLKSQSRVNFGFVYPHFCCINSNYALRYLKLNLLFLKVYMKRKLSLLYLKEVLKL